MSDTAKTLTKRLAKWWQEILGIQDWRVDVTFLDRKKYQERINYHSAGYCDATNSRQWASITINTDSEDKSDPEHSLVHEECHVLTNDVWTTTLAVLDNFITDAHTREFVKEDISAKLEIAVDKMATAMLRLKRMGEKAKTGV